MHLIQPYLDRAIFRLSELVKEKKCLSVIVCHGIIKVDEHLPTTLISDKFPKISRCFKVLLNY